MIALVLAVLVTAVAALIVTSRDAGRRERAAAGERARTEADEARRRFVRRLDHELKNPLTALLTALSPQASPAGHDVARAQAERLRRLLADLRRVADVETAELDRAPVDVEWLVREAVGSARADAGESRHVPVDLPNAPWPVPPVNGDPDLLLVAVYNVVANAIKYSQPDDTVEVRAREGPGPLPSVVIEIADTGPGIPAHEQGYVWEELARGRSAVGQPGSGVGLALVRVIVERHGGWVFLRSREGAGTSVQLHLPSHPDQRV